MRYPPAANLARAAAPLAPLALLALLLWRFPPQQYPFYPQCPIFQYLHLQCPGCGTTRALAALLHGNVAAALRLNALTTLSLPFALGIATRSYWRFVRRRTPCIAAIPQMSLYAAIAVCAVFTVMRNM